MCDGESRRHDARFGRKKGRILRKFLTLLKEAPGNVLWDISKWMFAGAISICAIIAALVNNLPWVYAIPLTIACSIVFALVMRAAIHSMRRLIPEPVVPLFAAIDELKKLRGELVHIFHLAQLSLLAKPLEALERLTWVIERSRILIKQDVFTDYISASDRNRYDTPYNEDDLINIERQYEKKGYLENVDETGRALFRHLYERCKRLDEVIGKINYPKPTEAASSNKTPVHVALIELRGLAEEGDVILKIFHSEELYSARPTLVDVEAYERRVQASVKRNDLKLSPGESGILEAPLPAGKIRESEEQALVLEGSSGDEPKVINRLVDRVDGVKRLLRRFESGNTP
jgi:hypothetical protein